ncbi:MAG: F0F1 ATP synthase subunit alpha, partial [Tannerella sp.]|nr:F0F1 ATP synthase subunit alpha [Tannerella sp.]
IDKGQKNKQLLIQPQYSPMPVEEQIAVLYCGTHGLLKNVALDQVSQFEQAFLNALRMHHKDDILTPLKRGQLDDSVTNASEKVAAEIAPA